MHHNTEILNYNPAKVQILLDITNYVLETPVSYFEIGHPAILHQPSFHNFTKNFKAISMYTDGSKTEKHVGAAFMVLNQKDMVLYQAYYKLHQKCSIVQADLFAVYKGINYIENHLLNSSTPTQIVTDSTTILKLINRPNIHHPLSITISKELTNILITGFPSVGLLDTVESREMN